MAPVRKKHILAAQVFGAIFRWQTEAVACRDLVDSHPHALFEENPFYAAVLRKWRFAHPHPPARPIPVSFFEIINTLIKD